MTAWTATDIPDLTGRTAIVTGANSGLGLVTATELARRGSDVILAVRNTAAGEDAARSIRSVAPRSTLTVREVDLAALDSVRRFAARVGDEHERIDMLVNNAGLVILGRRRTTSDGFELHLGTNHLGHFALTGLLLPLLSRSDRSRVVSLSSITHKGVHLDFDDLMFERRWDAARAYSTSKLATTVFGIEFDRRLRAAGSSTRSILAHPGVSRSNLTLRAWSDRGRVGRVLAELFGRVLTQPTARGALPQLHAAAAPDVEGGQFFGPSGRREWRGDVTEVAASAEALDPSVGKRVWEVSTELTGVGFG